MAKLVPFISEKIGQFLVTLFILFASLSCHFNTAISYRRDQDNEYVKEDGYIISCEKVDSNLVVGTYTPDSWGQGFYYDYLKGLKSDKMIKIKDIKVRFPETGDTLFLKSIGERKEYFFTSKTLAKIIDNNKRLTVNVSFAENNSDSIKHTEFILTRYKSTYPTGPFRTH